MEGGKNQTCTDLKQRILASLKTDVKRQSKDIHVIYNVQI